MTTIKKTEMLLKQSEEVFRYNFDLSPIGAAIVAPNYRFIRVNAMLCQMLGYSEKDLLNLTFKDITFKDDISKDLDEMEKLNRGEILNYTTEKRYVGKAGKLSGGICQPMQYETQPVK